MQQSLQYAVFMRFVSESRRARTSTLYEARGVYPTSNIDAIPQPGEVLREGQGVPQSAPTRSPKEIFVEHLSSRSTKISFGNCVGAEWGHLGPPLELGLVGGIASMLLVG